MSALIRSGCVLLMIGFLLTGCRSKPEETLVKEKIATLEKIAELMEKSATDTQAMEDAKTEIGPLFAKLKKLDEDLDALGKERKDAAVQVHAVQLSAALTRMTTAKKNLQKPKTGAKTE